MTESRSVDTVYVDGVFDLFHLGHMRMIKRARKYGRRVIVGVVTDEQALSYKRLPIIPYNIRIETVKESGLADEVIEAALSPNKEFIDKHGIDLIIHGDDSNQLEFYQEVYDLGKMLYIPYTEGISTTQILKWVHEREIPAPGSF